MGPAAKYKAGRLVHDEDLGGAVTRRSVAQCRIDTRSDAVAMGVGAVPDSGTASSRKKFDQMARSIQNTDLRIGHHTRDSDITLVRRAHWVRICIELIKRLVWHGSIAHIRDKACARADEKFARGLLDSQRDDLVAWQHGVLGREMRDSLHRIVIDISDIAHRLQEEETRIGRTDPEAVGAIDSDSVDLLVVEQIIAELTAIVTRDNNTHATVGRSEVHRIRDSEDTRRGTYPKRMFVVLSHATDIARSDSGAVLIDPALAESDMVIARRSRGTIILQEASARS